MALEKQLGDAQVKAKELETRLDTARQRNSDHVRADVVKVQDRAIESTTFWQRYGVAVLVGLAMLLLGACASGTVAALLKFVK